MKIPFLSFEYTNRDIKAEILPEFERQFDKAWYILGEDLKKFESAYAAFNDVKFAVGLSNGLDALFLSLKALGIGEGDKVIVPSNTYIATVLSITYVGAEPIFVEPDPATFNIDPKKIEAAITKGTRAIMPVHLYGQCCDMTAIMAIAKKHNLFVVEDNAQSHLASFDGKLAGSFGHINATSFYPGKNVGALGDAGGVTTNDAELAEKVKVLRNYGSQKKYYNEVIGYNKRLDELQAAFLLIKLKHIQKWTAQRQEVAGWYDQYLKGIPNLQLPVTAPGATHVYHLYVVQTPKRDALQEYLNSKEIGTLIHYPVPPHLQEAYANLGYKKGDFPIAEQMAEQCLSLPIWPGMNEEQVRFVATEISKFFDQNK